VRTKYCSFLVMSAIASIAIADPASASDVVSCHVETSFYQALGPAVPGSLPCRDPRMTFCTDTRTLIPESFDLPISHPEGNDELFYRSNGTTQAADDPTISTTLDLSISRVDGTFKLQRLTMNSLVPDHPMSMEDYTGHCEKQDVHTRF
jgi:hypothetical protein